MLLAPGMLAGCREQKEEKYRCLSISNLNVVCYSQHAYKDGKNNTRSLGDQRPLKTAALCQAGFPKASK